MKAFTMAAVLAAALAVAPAAQAGRSCETKKPTAPSVESGLLLAERTMQALDASGARVVVLARAGQDLQRYGQHYSHLGFAYKTPEGWRVLHKLNQCGTAASGVWRQGLGEFFLDDLWRYEAAWSVPTPEVQDRLVTLLQNQPRSIRLHHPRYSIVSYPWAVRYQQSNQWAIETLAMAMEPAITSRDGAQGWLRARGYQPDTLRLGPLTRLGARAGSANVAFDDHPDEKRFAGRIETVTADSVFRWLRHAGLGAAPVNITLR